MKIKSILSMLALVMLCSSSFGQTNWVSRFLEGCQLFGFNYPGYSAGFTLQIPLRNGSAKADYDRALNEREVSAKRKSCNCTADRDRGPKRLYPARDESVSYHDGTYSARARGTKAGCRTKEIRARHFDCSIRSRGAA